MKFLSAAQTGVMVRINSESEQRTLIIQPCQACGEILTRESDAASVVETEALNLQACGPAGQRESALSQRVFAAQGLEEQQQVQLAQQNFATAVRRLHRVLQLLECSGEC